MVNWHPFFGTIWHPNWKVQVWFYLCSEPLDRSPTCQCPTDGSLGDHCGTQALALATTLNLRVLERKTVHGKFCRFATRKSPLARLSYIRNDAFMRLLTGNLIEALSTRIPFLTNHFQHCWPDEIWDIGDSWIIVHPSKMQLFDDSVFLNIVNVQRKKTVEIEHVVFEFYTINK